MGAQGKGADTGYHYCRAAIWRFLHESCASQTAKAT
jgi:hypothetical protein